MQWAACKWGIADNVLRAMAVRESFWYQSEVYPSGRCVEDRGCSDIVTKPDLATRVYCTSISQFGYDYRADYPADVCPKTFSIVGVMSWHDPEWWRPMPGNQNGTFPFNRDSTAFALDYLGGYLRGCLEGWATWLGTTGDESYAPGDLWGCVGSWYAGSWKTPLAREYVRLVQEELESRTWLRTSFYTEQSRCSDRHGCPRGKDRGQARIQGRE